MKLYAVSDGPPSLAVRMALSALKIKFDHINVDFGAGEHMTDSYAKVSKFKFDCDSSKIIQRLFLDESTERDSSSRRRWILFV